MVLQTLLNTSSSTWKPFPHCKMQAAVNPQDVVMHTDDDRLEMPHISTIVALFITCIKHLQIVTTPYQGVAATSTCSICLHLQ